MIITWVQSIETTTALQSTPFFFLLPSENYFHSLYQWAPSSPNLGTYFSLFFLLKFPTHLWKFQIYFSYILGFILNNLYLDIKHFTLLIPFPLFFALSISLKICICSSFLTNFHPLYSPWLPSCNVMLYTSANFAYMVLTLLWIIAEPGLKHYSINTNVTDHSKCITIHMSMKIFWLSICDSEVLISCLLKNFTYCIYNPWSFSLQLHSKIHSWQLLSSLLTFDVKYSWLMSLFF